MSAPDANGWFDISSAPKDGTAVWVWYEGGAFIGYCEPANREWRPTDTWFLKASVRRSRIIGLPDDIFGCYVHDVAPSHWQPLPKPPITNSLSSTPPAMTKPAGSQPSQPAGTPSKGAA